MVILRLSRWAHKLYTNLNCVTSSSFKFSSRHFHFSPFVIDPTSLSLRLNHKIAIGCNRKHNCIQNLFIEFSVLRILFACSTFFLLLWITYLNQLASEPFQMLTKKEKKMKKDMDTSAMVLDVFLYLFNYDVAIWNNLYPTCLIFNEATKIINQIFKYRMSLQFSFVLIILISFVCSHHFFIFFSSLLCRINTLIVLKKT